MQLQTIANQLSLLIIGDVMLDHYVWGKVERISPEAPVPIVAVEKEEYRLGGAANVALNLISLGAKVSLCGVIGHDKEADILLDLANKVGIDTSFMLQSPNRKTTVKTRIIAMQQQMLRIDKEDSFYLTVYEENTLINLLSSHLLADYQTIIFEDYDKGMITANLIQAVTKGANEAQIPVLVDPKKRQFLSYQNCFLFKPNLKELAEGLNYPLKRNDLPEIQKAIALLRKKMPHQHTLVTLSENGMLWVDDNLQPHHIPTKAQEVLDVSGAGDTVIAVAALCIAANMDLQTAFELANLAGGKVCAHVGVVPITWEMLSNG